MAGFTTTYTANKLLSHMLNGTAWTMPTTVHLGLCTAEPAKDGSVVGEPAIGTNAYARVAIANNGTTVFGTASAGACTNSAAAITFPTATPSGWTGTLTHWFISDAATAGNTLFYGQLGTSITVAAQQAPSFATSNFTFTCTSW